MRWRGYRGGPVECMFENEKCTRLDVVISVDACLTQIDINECIFNRNICNEEIKPTITGSIHEIETKSIQKKTVISINEIIAPMCIPIFEIGTTAECGEFQTSFQQSTTGMDRQDGRKAKMWRRIRKQCSDTELYHQYVQWCSIIEMRMIHHFNYDIMMHALCLVSNKKQNVLKESSDMKSREATMVLNMYISILLKKKYVKV